MTLGQQLRDSEAVAMTLGAQLRRAAEPWLSEEVLAPARSAALAALVRRQARTRRLLRWLRTTAVAAAAAGALITWPVLVSVASEVPVVGPVVLRMAGFDRGADWATENGYVVPVGKTAGEHGYTVRVESVLADAARTEIAFAVEGPNLTAESLPVIDATFNYRSPSGGSRLSSAIVDGRLVGTLTLPPLPHPVALVTVTVDEINGVKGSWKVAFMASRTALDKLTRYVSVDASPEPASGGDAPNAAPAAVTTAPGPAATMEGTGDPLPAGAAPTPPAGVVSDPPEDVSPLTITRTWPKNECGFTVTRLVLAPTETVVEIGGPAARVCDIREAELTAGGRPVSTHMSSWSQGTYRLVFDRLEGEPAAVTLRLKQVVTWQPGGPVIDATRAGARTNYGPVWLELESVRHEGGKTIAVLKLGPEGERTAEAADGFRRWALVDAEGQSHWVTDSRGYWDGTPAAWHLELTVAGEVKAVQRLEVGTHAVPVPNPFEVTIPLQ